jgi:aminoglycoside/choline kinase family phosphotransferase
LIERDGAPLGVIDFQDAVWGPVTYDLVSLLKDCYILWPRERVSQWLATYLQLAQDVGLLLDVSQEQLHTWFDLMGLQRHIKVLGVFARLALHYQKPGYLQDLPLVLHYVINTAAQYPQTRPYADFIEREVMPRAEQQAWYKDIVEPRQ